jgi:hypothetical protein
MERVENKMFKSAKFAPLEDVQLIEATGQAQG